MKREITNLELKKKIQKSIKLLDSYKIEIEINEGTSSDGSEYIDIYVNVYDLEENGFEDITVFTDLTEKEALQQAKKIHTYLDKHFYHLESEITYSR